MEVCYSYCMAFNGSNIRKQKDVFLMLQRLLEKTEMLEDHMAIRRADGATPQVDLETARYLIRETDLQNIKACVATLRWDIGELDDLNF